ncbi:hypothetical protein GIB67_024166 [Kingdonia uniflora]|uniref:non-specific serine/threonine protein kinase n=1 Tax=Kingdonia uniflora TaxID=39325 RepID=A0A7J7LZC0_9MAGN|nr:hypothetical protein GIB67_024166 [Kingdonia uniflora]
MASPIHDTTPEPNRPSPSSLADSFDRLSFNSTTRSSISETTTSSTSFNSTKHHHPNLKLTDLRFIRKLGSGDIGCVYLAQLKGTLCKFAAKVMDKKELVCRNKEGRARTEREILEMLDHPFLPKLYGCLDSVNWCCLLTEFCPGGDLHVLRQRQFEKRFDEPAVRFYASEVVVALEYVHMMGIVYRDLKPENVLVRSDGMDDEYTMANIVARALDFPKESAVSANLKDLITHLLVKDPIIRMGSTTGMNGVQLYTIVHFYGDIVRPKIRSIVSYVGGSTKLTSLRAHSSYKNFVALLEETNEIRREDCKLYNFVHVCTCAISSVQDFTVMINMHKSNPGTPFQIWIVNELRVSSQNSQNFISDFCSSGKGLSTTKDTGSGKGLSTTKAGGPLRHNSFPDPEPEYRGYPETNGSGLDPRRFGHLVDDDDIPQSNDSFKTICTDVPPSNESSIPQLNVNLSNEPVLTNVHQSNEPF